MARRRNNQGDPASLLSCYHFHVLISEPAYFFFTSCDVVQTCSLSFISYDGGVFFLSPTLQLSSLQLSLSMLLTPRRESRGSIYLALASTCVSISGNAKVTRIFTDTRNGFEHIISDPLVFSPSSLYFLLFSLHDLRHMTWERSLLSKGNGNGNGNTGVNHCFIFFIIFCVLFFSSLCVFSISYLVSCMARYLFMSLCGLRSILSQDVTHIGRACYFLLCLIGIQTSLAMESVAYAGTWVMFFFCSVDNLLFSG